MGGDTISVSIGQGFNSYTLLQLAHAVATLANNGVIMKPHLVKIVEDGATHQRTLTVPKESRPHPAEAGEHRRSSSTRMVGVMTDQSGTGYRTFRDAAYVAAGKTGTAQVVGLKGAKYNDHLDRRNACATTRCSSPSPLPTSRRIAIALVVENAGWGGAGAAPIARKALDYYLLGKRLQAIQACGPLSARAYTDPGGKKYN